MTSGSMRGVGVALVVASTTGGTGRHVRAIVDALIPVGARVVVAGPQDTDHRFGFRRGGARFLALPMPAGMRPGAAMRAVARLCPVVRDADLVHAHGLRAAVVAKLAGAGRRSRFVITWHNAPPPAPWRSALFRATARWVARRAGANLAVSADLVALLHRLGAAAELAPVGATALPTARRTTTEVRAEFDARERPLVLAVGRLHPQKGYDVLLRAAELWQTHEPAPVVAIAGDGPLRDELTRRVASGRADVRLLGERDDVADLLRAADVVVMPSRWEGSPLALHEALQAGRPVVASAVGGLPALGEGGAIALVPPGDAAALAACVARLLDDPVAARDLAARGAARLADWPDARGSAARTVDAYVELLGSS